MHCTAQASNYLRVYSVRIQTTVAVVHISSLRSRMQLNKLNLLTAEARSQSGAEGSEASRADAFKIP